MYSRYVLLELRVGEKGVAKLHFHDCYTGGPKSSIPKQVDTRLDLFVAI